LHDDEFIHLTTALSPVAPAPAAAAEDIEVAANRPATISAIAAPLNVLVFMGNS
jgi:hypothetical protein